MRPESSGCSLGYTFDESHPCLPSWDIWVGPCQTYFWLEVVVRVKETKGQRKEKKIYVLGRVTTSDTQSPKEEACQSLALALLLGSSQLSPELHPLQDSNPVEAAGWSCDSRRWEREEGTTPQAAHSQLWQEGSREGKREGEAEAEGDLEAQAGQQKGRALGTKAHLRICSASAGPLVLGHHGTAAGHGSVQEIHKWDRFSKESL